MTAPVEGLASPRSRPGPVPAFRLLLLALVALAAPARAQAPLTLVDDDTQVKTVTFDFVNGQTLFEQDLELQVATTPRPGAVLGFFAGGRDEEYPFSPIELARDVVRLTRYYETSGFPQAEVDYAVELDTARNAVDVTFVIDEGPPLVIGDVEFRGPGQSDVAAALAPEVRDEWATFTRRKTVRTGDRLSLFALVELQGQTVSWLRNRGYAWADAGAEQFPDSTGLRADVRVKVNVGPRVRVRSVRVEGDSSLAAGVVAREIPIQAGDLFDAGALSEGQREVFGLGLFQLALVNVAPEAVRGDTLVDVVARVRRGPSRVANAFAGYFSEGGVTLRGAFTHRNAFGGARQLGVDAEWRTGQPDVTLPGFLGGGQTARSVAGGPIRDLRFSVPFRQPYVFDRRLSYTLQPSFRDREDEIEASRTFEVSNALLLTLAPLKTAALSVTGRRRDLSRGLGIRLLDAGRFALPPGPFLPDSLRATTGIVSLDVVYGQLDNTLQPTRGFVLRPSLALSGGDVTYARARLAASVTVPVRPRVGLVARVTVGAIRPLGDTSSDAVGDYILLRDQLFYAGGTADVRGWAAARLGPKAFSVTPPVRTPGEIPDPSRITSPRDVNYVGVGGQLKGSASVQLNVPLPLGPQWGANVFLDAGAVGGPAAAATAGLVRAGGAPADSTLADILEDEGGLRAGAGASIQYLTPVGFVSLGLGFKLNPSYLDRREPGRVYCGSSLYDAEPAVCFGGVGSAPDAAPGYIDARLSGTDFNRDAIPELGFIGSRIQVHISIGQTF